MSSDTPLEDTGPARPVAPASPPPERRKGGFFRWLFSHLLVAVIAIAAAAAYFHWTGMMGSIEGYVCSKDMLGRYAASPDPAPEKAPDEAMETPAPEAAPEAMVEPSAMRTPPAPKTVPQTAPPIDPPIDPLEAAWLDARRAYWTDGPAAAEAYQTLIAARPDIAGLHGELGNVYFQAGDSDKAAGQYYQAGTRYIAQGNSQRADDIITILEQLDPALAAGLSQSRDSGG